jgi:predicted Zn-dependent protease
MSSGRLNGRKVLLRAAWLTMGLLLLASAVGCGSLKEHLAMRDAATAYKGGKYEDAAKNFEAALKINPSRADNWKYLGYSYWSLVGSGSNKKLDQQYTDKALDAFQKYLKIHGKDDDLQDYIIGLYVNQDRIDDGIKYYEGELRNDPKDARIIQVIATMYTRKGDFKNSLRYSQMKAELTPNEAGGYLFIGALCWDQSYRHNKEMSLEDRVGVVETGMKAMDKALSIDAKSMNAYVFKGLLYRQKAEIAKIQGDEERDRKKKKDLLQQSEDYLKQADECKNKALEIRKASQPPTAPAPAPGASQKG